MRIIKESLNCYNYKTLEQTLRNFRMNTLIPEYNNEIDRLTNICLKEKNNFKSDVILVIDLDLVKRHYYLEEFNDVYLVSQPVKELNQFLKKIMVEESVIDSIDFKGIKKYSELTGVPIEVYIDDLDFWIKENFDSEDDYCKSILEFKGINFLRMKDGFLGFRFSVKKYFIWVMNTFGMKEILVDRDKHSVIYATKDKKLIVEFSYKDLKDNKLDSLKLRINDKYSGGTIINTYYNFNQLMQEATELVANILVDEFPDKFDIEYAYDLQGRPFVKVPQTAA